MTDETSVLDQSADPMEQPPGTMVCPVCERRSADPLVRFEELSDDLKTLVYANATDQVDEVCRRCVDIFNRALVQLKEDAAVFEQGGHVLSTPLRLDADDRFTGRGVTIAFLDSGFYPHPDLVKPKNRVLAYHSIVEDDHTKFHEPDMASWHGMMTSVVAAGNGSLSNGFYRGISPDANVVLVKLAKTGRISEHAIERGLKWVLDHKDKYGIKIVNISAGGDNENSYLHSSLCKTVEKAVREGLVVVCAVGNAGMHPGHPVLPPASSPSAIAVGGLDDQNSLDRARRGMYRSSYGPTADGLQKPELLAPGIWVAAPILPGTPTAEQAELFATLDDAPDDQLRPIIEKYKLVDKDLFDSRDLRTPMLRQLITIKLREENLISGHYKYVDGTSFSAPIVASIIACMLEANPRLSPQQVKRLLIETAERLPFVEVDRQGWGVVAPRRAVERAIEIRNWNARS